jgi:hypothetical protein
VNVVAVVDAPAPGLQTVAVGALAAVVDDGLDNGDQDPVLRHGAIVDRVFALCPAVLPTRAGTRLDDEAAVRTWLEAERDTLGRALDRVRGSAELAVTWQGPDDEPTSPTDGAAYLRALADRWSGSRAARDELEATHGLPGVRGVRVLAQMPTVVKGSVLVERDAVEGLLDRLGRLDPCDGSWRTSGPFPPYSFVAGDQ